MFVRTAKCVIQNRLHYIEPINMSGLLPSYGWYLNYFFTQASAKWNIGVLDEVVWVPLNVFLIKG